MPFQCVMDAQSRDRTSIAAVGSSALGAITLGIHVEDCASHEAVQFSLNFGRLPVVEAGGLGR